MARPLKTLVLEILLVLIDAERHGWDLARELDERFGDSYRILPGNLYRTLRDMRRAGWIEETASPRLEDGDERRRYYRVTAAGRAAARHESERLRQLVLEARSLRLLSRRR